jgi:ribonuclease VapC
VKGPAIDSSVLLAVILAEPGWQAWVPLIERGVISAVNIAEVVARLVDRGVPEAPLNQLLRVAELTVVPHDLEQALESGRLRALTRHAGLSLGDRACLALARTHGLSVLTADRVWATLALDVPVELIR